MRYITKKEFRNIINETASGFKVNYPKTAAAVQQNAANSAIPDYDRVELVNDPKVRSGKDWAEKGGNFPIKRNGKVFYVSRSVAVSLYAFCQDSAGRWCILANQRGPGCFNQRYKWNPPCGFLDYNETAEQAAARETREETGVIVPVSLIKQMGVNTKSETVRIRFACVLPGTTDNYPLSAEGSEPGEVNDIKWIPLAEVHKYSWTKKPEEILDQAYTSLSHIWEPKGYSGTTPDINKITMNLRNEIRNNPRANILLDALLDYYNPQTGKYKGKK